MSVSTVEQALIELVDRHRALYDAPAIEGKLKRVVRAGSHTELTVQDILRVLRTSQSVFFDTHVEMVSGHHTATYLRFESIARFPELIKLLAEPELLEELLDPAPPAESVPAESVDDPTREDPSLYENVNLRYW